MKGCIALLSCLTVFGCASPAVPEAAPATPRTVYLLGRFSAPMGKADLTNQLRQNGFVVADRMSERVDVVVLGSDPVNEAGDGFAPLVDLPEYRTATAHGLELVARADVPAKLLDRR